MTSDGQDTATIEKSYFFFVDEKKYDWTSASITGAQIRASLPGLPPTFQIIYEGRGGEPDRPVEPGDTFNLDPKGHGALKFYTAPPATFGSN